MTDAPIASPTALTIVDHWLTGPGVTRVAMHASWFGKAMTTGRPRGIVAHYTATNAGTALAMARRRARSFGQDKDDRLASWHVTIEADGSIVAMIALDRIAWHAGSSTARPVPGLGNANASTIGIELVGHGKAFPAAQVEAAARVWRAVIQHYGIARAHAMISHASIDPGRRADPGPVWMAEHAPDVLEYAYRVAETA
jgi:N-acetyl-anhydromuramyl-L-alanine amidase AmpD